MTAMTPPQDTTLDPIPVRVQNFPDPAPEPRRPATVRVIPVDNTAGSTVFAREVLGNIPSRRRALIQVISATDGVVCILAKDRGDAANGNGFPILANAQATELTDDEEWHIGVPAGVAVTIGVYAQFAGSR